MTEEQIGEARALLTRPDESFHPVAKKTTKSTDKLAEELAALGQELRRTAAGEVRAEIARAIQERFLGRPGVDRAVYAGRSPEDCPIEELTENHVMQGVPALAAAAERLDEDGVTDDFRAGVAFVVALLADPAFDY